MDKCKYCKQELKKERNVFCNLTCKYDWQKGRPALNKIILDETKILKDYNTGLSMIQIADKFNVSGPTINKVIKKYGVSRKQGFDIKENNPSWKGGILPISKKIRGIPQYKEWRLMVFGRDDFTCQKCWKRGCYLEAHHIRTFSFLLNKYNIINIGQALNCEQLWNINNGLTLCLRCHKKKHMKAVKLYYENKKTRT